MCELVQPFNKKRRGYQGCCVLLCAMYALPDQVNDERHPRCSASRINAGLSTLGLQTARVTLASSRAITRSDAYPCTYHVPRFFLHLPPKRAAYSSSPLLLDALLRVGELKRGHFWKASSRLRKTPVRLTTKAVHC